MSKFILKKNNFARPVGDFVGKIIEPVLLSRYGITMDLLAIWPELVGMEYCQFTKPEKISWPKFNAHDYSFRPGTLVVACDSSKVLFFQYETTRVCQAVNNFFGFEAIKRVKVIQKYFLPVKNTKKFNLNTSLTKKQQQKLEIILSKIENEKLREKLAKLGYSVMNKRKSL